MKLKSSVWKFEPKNKMQGRETPSHSVASGESVLLSYLLSFELCFPTDSGLTAKWCATSQVEAFSVRIREVGTKGWLSADHSRVQGLCESGCTEEKEEEQEEEDSSAAHEKTRTLAHRLAESGEKRKGKQGVHRDDAGETGESSHPQSVITSRSPHWDLQKTSSSESSTPYHHHPIPQPFSLIKIQNLKADTLYEAEIAVQSNGRWSSFTHRQRCRTEGVPHPPQSVTLSTSIKKFSFLVIILRSINEQYCPLHKETRLILTTS